MGKFRNIFLLSLSMILAAVSMYAQESDKRDVRRGNRKFGDGDFRESVVDYQKALLRDSTSFAASYNMANALYRLDNAAEGKKILDTLASVAPASEYASDYYYNLGNMALAEKNYQEAVDAYKQSLLRNPGDVDAKENYIYAKKKLEDQQNQQNQDQQDQNQNQDQQGQNDQDQNQDKDNQDKNKDGDNNQDQQNPGQQPQNQGQQPQQQPQQGQPKISKQAAQQMINAMLAKEKETQDKVKKEKAAAMQSKQKEKNW